MNNQVAVFNNQNLALIEQNNQKWFTSQDLAKALGYARSDQVTQIFNRNRSEFSDDMTLTVNLTVKGFGSGDSTKPVRIFSLRGCHLLAMFARTPVAKAFRRWTLDLIEIYEKETGHYLTPAMLKVIGGVVKNCCRTVIREELGLAQQEIEPEKWQSMLNNTALMIELTAEGRAKQKLKSAIEYIEQQN